jgi:hypothetical protein
MIKNKLELGNFDLAGPIMLKEKIGKDGAITTRIYQRKDIQSTENLITRMKNTVKYSIEDFFIENKTFQPILRLIGLKKINRPDFSAIENPNKLFENLKSGKKDAFNDINSIVNLKKFLNFNNIDITNINKSIIDGFEDKKFIQCFSEEYVNTRVIETSLAVFLYLNETNGYFYELNDPSLEISFKEIILFIKTWPEEQPTDHEKKQFFRDKLINAYENIVFKWMSDRVIKEELLDLCKGSEEIVKKLKHAFSNSESISRDEKREALDSAKNYLEENEQIIPFGLKQWASTVKLLADTSIIKHG